LAAISRERHSNIAYNQHIKDLYDRLKGLGFNANFIRATVLPDWWEDSLASVPANRAMAEIAISRLLGLPITDLRKPRASLKFPAMASFRLKRSGRTTHNEVRAAVLVAEKVAEIAADAMAGLPAFSAAMSAQEIRREILTKRPHVNLESLVEFCWGRGIVVLHVDPDRLPGKKFQGLAMFVDQRPVLILGSAKDSPPWLAFHLAHEVGHVFGKDVEPGDDPIVDGDIDKADNSRQEHTADRFATEVLTGKPTMEFRAAYGMTGPKLANAVRDYGLQNAFDPGTVALIYGRSAQRWGPAQIALKCLGQSAGGKEIIADALAEHLDLSDLPESAARFLSCLSSVPV